MISNFFRRLFRDPDPLWRWASGQYARRWWRHPMAFALGGALILVVTVSASVLHAFQNASSSDAWKEAASHGVLFSATVALFTITFPFLAVPGRPSTSLDRLGGPVLLRQLALSSRSSREIGKALFWGSYRAAAVPWILLYLLAWLLAGMYMLWGEENTGGNIAILKDILIDAPDFFLPTFLTPPLPRRLRLSPAFPGDPLAVFSRFTIAFWLLAKPVIDHAIHLAIAWWVLFRSGGSRHGYWLLLVALVFLFPFLGQAFAFILRMLPITGLYWFVVDGLAFLAGWKLARWALRFVRKSPGKAHAVIPALAGAALSCSAVAWLYWLWDHPQALNVWRVQYRNMAYIAGPWLAWLLKAGIGWRCHRRFVHGWPGMLERNFPDSA